MALALCACILSTAATPSRLFQDEGLPSYHGVQLLAPRGRDSDPADRNPFGLPFTYEGGKRVYRTDILRETGQQPKWLQEKEAAQLRMERLKLMKKKEKEKAGHVSGPSAGHHERGSAQASALREKATSSAKGAVKAGKTVIRSAKGALRKGVCFFGGC